MSGGAHEPRILEHLLLLITCSIPLAIVLRRLGQSTILAYLLTGIVIGPGGLRLVPRASVDLLAEVGAGLLLFAIGIELSLGRLLAMRRVAFGGGALQVFGTAALFGGAAHLVTGRPAEALFVGFMAALSSSAIVLKTLADRRDLDAPHTGAATAISVFQDLATVALIVILPAIAARPGGEAAPAGAGEVAARVGLAVGKAAALLAVLALGARVFVGRLLHQVARARSPEIFVLTVMALLLGAAYGSSLAGLSLSLGAFVAGLLLSEGEYAHQILADVLPFKGVFQAIFFVSVGMLLDPAYVAAHPLAVLGGTAAVILGKAIVCALALTLVGLHARVAAATGVALAQVGEFSFILLSEGRLRGAVSDESYPLLLAVAVGSMALAPPLVGNVRGIVDALARLPLLDHALAGRPEAHLRDELSHLEGHVVICGMGPVGREVATFLLDAGTPFVAIELNPKTVRDLADAGIAIFFGDFANPHVLEMAGIDRARALVIAAPDHEAALRAVRAARSRAPGLMIVARTKYRTNVAALVKAGADEVIEEEFEAAVEVVSRLSRALDIARGSVAERMEAQRLERFDVGGGVAAREETQRRGAPGEPDTRGEA